jgi:hypothetical protein
VDPLAGKFPELTTYQYASNSPVAMIDLDGLEGWHFTQQWVQEAVMHPDGAAAATLGLAIGASEELSSTAEGVLQVVSDPIGTHIAVAERVASLATPMGPHVAAAQVATGVQQDVQRFEEGNAIERESIAGRCIVRAAELFFGTKGAAGSLKVVTLPTVEITAVRTAVEGGGNLAIRSDIVLSGGRSGQLVKMLTGPTNSVVKGGQGRIFITDNAGKVIWDVTKDRAKSVVPGQGFGPKVAPTQEQLNLIKQVWED